MTGRDPSESGSIVDRLAARSQRLRVPVLVLIVLLGVVLSAVSAHRSHRQQRQVLQLTFHDDVQEHLLAISRALEQSLEQVRTLGDFLRTSERLDRQRFADFALPTLRRHPTIHALAWVPRVTDERRAEFEAGMSADLGEPFHIAQPGRGAPSPRRELYYPLAYVEPRARPGDGPGTDLAPDAERMRTLEQAAAEGRLVLSPPLKVGSEAVAERGEGRTLIAFAPVYDTASERADEPRPLLGFAAAEFRVADVVGDYLTAWKHGELRVFLFDVSLPSGEQLIYPPSLEAQVGVVTPERVLASSPLWSTERIRVGGREWLLICTPSRAYVREHLTTGPWVVLGGGLLLTALVGVILFGLIRSGDLMTALAQARERVNAELRQRIAEREAGQQALAQANEDLRRANQDLERFVGAVSHDLKSPLVAAEMLISVLQQALAKQDLIRAGETSAQVRRACTRMRQIIDDLLEHQKAGYADMTTTPVDLVEVALGIVEDRRSEWTQRGAHVQIHDDLPTVRADRARLTVALDNLFLNAIRYGAAADESLQIELGAELTAEEVRLFVRDHGPGIAAEHRERVFELFRRLAKDEEGTGIGLAIVRRVAEAHGGRAWVECPPPEAGGGSAFYLALPIDRLVKSEPREPAHAADPVAVGV